MRSYSNQTCMQAGIQSSTVVADPNYRASHLYPEIVTSFSCIVSYQEHGYVFIISRRSSFLARS